jgi:O-antigen/teichoic acid export membrane protein
MLMSAAFLFSSLVQFAISLLIAWILGPEAFGVHALAIAGAVLVQALMFDWIRLGMTRFGGVGDPAFRRRLDRMIALQCAICLLLAGMAWFAGGPYKTVLALVPLVALVTGLADYLGADLRARFRQGPFAVFNLLRAMLGIAVSGLAAWHFRTPQATILAFGAATLIAILVMLPILRRTRAEPGSGDTAEESVAAILAYSWPLIVTSLAYLALFFALRAFVTREFGLATGGQFSLALEFGLKLVMTLGTALDVYLFQVAVRETRSHSPAEVRQRLRWNAEIVLALLAAALLGAWLVLPGLQVLLVSADYRTAFAAFFGALLPGLLAYGVIQYAIHPFGQIDGRTRWLAIAALAGLVSGVGMMPLMGGLSPYLATGLVLGVAMSGSVFLLMIRTGWPLERPLMLLARLAGALSAMALAVWPLRAFMPDMAATVIAVIAGGIVMLAAAFVLDIGRMRAIVKARALPPIA